MLLIITTTGLCAQADRVDVIIGLREAATASDLNVIAAVGGEVRYSYSIINAVAARIPEPARETLANERGVAYITDDSRVFALGQTLPWGIDRVFGNDSNHRSDTWTVSAGGQGIKVAILDTGIDGNHEDLVVAGGQNFDGIGGPDDWHDGHGHGTHVAGTVAALNNTIGVVGVAPQVDLYAVKVLDDWGYGQRSDLIAGIEWALGEGIQIINMSLQNYDDEEDLEEAINNAYAAGVLLVGAAGNHWHGPVSVPGKYADVITVTASDVNDGLAWFSNIGPEVELIAPGVDVESTLPGDTYGSFNGTSMASPHIAGAAALVWAIALDLTNVQVRELLQESAEDIGLHVDYQGYGLVRADHAVALTRGPIWWTSRGVLTTDPADDYAAVNQGQLKHIATQAFDELEDNLTGGAGQDLTNLIGSWETPGSGVDDFEVINLGQLKNVSSLFYDRLITEGVENEYPWANSQDPADDYAMANLGQLKNVFSFELE